MDGLDGDLVETSLSDAVPLPSSASSIASSTPKMWLSVGRRRLPSISGPRCSVSLLAGARCQALVGLRSWDVAHAT
jgi:hypothetical protein